MNVAVYDTYVAKKNGGTAHFDVVVPEGTSLEQVLGFGREFLRSIGQEGQPLSAQECAFCHVEPAADAVRQAIQQHGYFIKAMEGCR
ncbi:MAG TPA: DUF2024 family protein [Verrucomicrobiota bacterium]|nr:DUF2024 family protein [Verrucomicrobiota bacterium]HNT14834.1 DUF2024 family protein [Verrucomicrobiota bacterium]